MEHPIVQMQPEQFPPLLKEITDPPERLYRRGTLPSETHALLTVVGSRKYTTYGKQVVESLIAGLRGYPLSVVSGLALGIDSHAHRAALQAGIHTIAIPGSGLHDTVLYPRTHYRLAQQILRSGGALLSEFEPNFRATPWCFTQRNRIVAGMSHATLVVEASKRSGTLITARLATEYNRDVLAVPGSIFSENSGGAHMLIGLGATPICSAADILEALDIEERIKEVPYTNLSPREKQVLELLAEPLQRNALIQKLNLDSREANALLSEMELSGHIREEAGFFTREISPKK